MQYLYILMLVRLLNRLSDIFKKTFNIYISVNDSNSNINICT